MTPQAVLCDVNVNTRKQLFELIAMKTADLTQINYHVILERMLEREKLLTSAATNGVAVPMAELPLIDEAFTVIVKLKKPVAFESVDRQPVDVVCAFFAPEGRGSVNLCALSSVMRQMADATTVNLIRGASKEDAVMAILTDHETMRMAA